MASVILCAKALVPKGVDFIHLLLLFVFLLTTTEVRQLHLPCSALVKTENAFPRVPPE